MSESEAWFRFLDEGQQDLVRETGELWVQAQQRARQGERLHDYAFTVFPMAKAYEGMLKKWFFRLGLISQKTYEGERFRVGKALNPDLPGRMRGRWWMYGPIEKKCGPNVAERLWAAWRECRNRLFHYFQAHRQFITLEEAEARIRQLEEAMATAVACGI